MTGEAVQKMGIVTWNVTVENLEKAALAMARNERVSTLALAVKHGRTIVDTCYGRSWATWNSRNAGDTGLERLSAILKEKHGLHFSPSTLYRYVRAAEQADTYGNFERWPNLSLAHVVGVQGLDWKEQDVLLERCNRENLSMRDLALAVAEIRGKAAPRSKRRAGASARVMLRKLDKSLDQRHELAAVLGEAGLPAEEVAALVASLEASHDKLEALQARVPAPAAPSKSRKMAVRPA